MGMSKRVGKTYKYWWLTEAAKRRGMSRRAVIADIRSQLAEGGTIGLGLAIGSTHALINEDQTPQGHAAWKYLSIGAFKGEDAFLLGMKLSIMLQELEDTLHQRGKPKRWKKKP